ncbi:signal peptidase I [Enterococcus sp. LJL120]
MNKREPVKKSQLAQQHSHQTEQEKKNQNKNQNKLKTKRRYPKKRTSKAATNSKQSTRTSIKQPGYKLSKRRIRKRSLIVAGGLSFLLLLLIMTWKLIVSPQFVRTNAMAPQLEKDTLVWLSPMAKIERFAVVCFVDDSLPTGKSFGRVIALPGEAVRYRNDQLLIDGKRMTEDFLTKELAVAHGNNLLLTTDFDSSSLTSEKVPEKHYFVMADNRLLGQDSRQLGYIQQTAIIGSVWGH